MGTIVTPETPDPGRTRRNGHDIGRAAIAEILKRNGIEPVPEREGKTPGKEFLEQHLHLVRMGCG